MTALALARRDAMRTVARDSRGFWRLWDRARAVGAEVKPGTPALQWSLSAGHRYPCTRPRPVGRISGLRTRDLIRRTRRPGTIHRVRLKKGVIDYDVPGGEVVEIAARTRVGYKNTVGHIDLWGRCRVCEACTAQERALWTARATAEVRYCRGRSWFVTLTVRPLDRDWLEAQAIKSANERSVNWHELPPEQRRQRLFRAFYREVSLYLKRVREELRVKGRRRVRFLAVCEAHKDGFPHAHLLIHEESFADANERTLRKKWLLGHAKAVLVADARQAATYVTKYVTKSALVIRASQKYGRSQPQALYEPSASVQGGHCTPQTLPPPSRPPLSTSESQTETTHVRDD